MKKTSCNTSTEDFENIQNEGGDEQIVNNINNKSNIINSKDNTSSESHSRDQLVEHDTLQKSAIPKSHDLEQKFTNNQCYEEQNREEKIVQMLYTRNLNLEDPRTKTSSNCDRRRNQLFLKFIKFKTYQVDEVAEIEKIEEDEKNENFEKIEKTDETNQGVEFDEIGEISECDEIDEINNDSKNTEIIAHQTVKIEPKRKLVPIKEAIKDENIKDFLEKLDKYREKHAIKLISGKKNHFRRLNFNKLDQNFQFCDPFLVLEKFIKALGSITKNHGAICKVGSTEAKLEKDKSGYLKIFVQRNYGHLELSDIVAVYTYDVNFRNHYERVAVQCGRGLSGIGNEENDFGAVIVKKLKHVRLLYIDPLNISKEKELSVKHILRSNSNDNNYIHIVTHCLLEMSNIESTFCGECNKVCIGMHSHKGTPEVYKNDGKIDLNKTGTLNQLDLQKVEETRELIHGSARFSTIFERYKEIILHWTNYFKQNFGGCKYVISSHEPYFKISSYTIWYQNKRNKFEIKTLQKILMDVLDPSSHLYKCKIIKKCIFESSIQKDTEKHMKEHHFTELTADEVTKKVLQSIVNNKK